MKKLFSGVLAFLFAFPLFSSEGGTMPMVPFIKVQAERLPDLNTPRNSCAVFYLNGELTVAGGHTRGFRITNTLEYFQDGRWNQLESVYPHDHSFALELSDGTVMLGGGCDSDFGVGQSYGVETYDPRTHAFTPLPILDRKRTNPTAVELGGGRVLVSGNWYAEDDIEMYFPGEGFKYQKASSEQRTHPLILRTGENEALVFSGIDTFGNSLKCVVDRLNGDPFEVPLFDVWHPVSPDHGMVRPYAFIGDAAADDWSYLLPVMQDDGSYGIVLAQGENFSLLPLQADIPLHGEFGDIFWALLVLADPSRKTVYVPGADSDSRIYLLAVDYGKALSGGEAAPLTVYYTNPLPTPICSTSSAILPDGRIVFAGGREPDSYLEICSAVYMLTPPGVQVSGANGKTWGFIAGALSALLLAVLAAFAFGRKKKTSSGAEPSSVPDLPSSKEDELMERIVALMEERQAFRRKGLKLDDIAKELGTNTKYVSACINNKAGVSFSDFVNGYRMEYIQGVLKEQGNVNGLAKLAYEAGFGSEASFFRYFKSATGKTPSQWIAEQ